MNLDENGRCCGRKPLTYKRLGEKFCFRCDRAYGIHTGHQKENWAWQLIDNEWRRVDSDGKPISTSP